MPPPSSVTPSTARPVVVQGGAHPYGSPVGARFNGVEEDVQHDLLQLVGRAAHLSQRFAQFDGKAQLVLGHQEAQRVDGRRCDGVQIGAGRRRRSGSGIGADAPDQGRDAVGLGLDPGEGIHLVLFPLHGLQPAHMGQDGAQGVVDLVRDPR